MSDANNKVPPGAPAPPSLPTLISTAHSERLQARDNSSLSDNGSYAAINIHRLPMSSPMGVQDLSTVSAHRMSSGAALCLSDMTSPGECTDLEHANEAVLEQTLSKPGEHTSDNPEEQEEDNRFEQAQDTHSEGNELIFLFDEKIAAWSENEEKMIKFFRFYRHCVTNHKHIAVKLDIPYGTVRNIIRRLVALGYIQTKIYKKGVKQGIEVWYCGPDAVQGNESNLDCRATAKTGIGQTSSTEVEQAPRTETEHSHHINEREKERQKDQSIWSLSVEQIQELWPNVRRAGLFARFIPYARFPTLVHQGHEGAERVQTAGKTRVSVKLHQNFLDFVDGQPRLQAFCQGGFQSFKMAARRKCGYGNYGLLSCC